MKLKSILALIGVILLAGLYLSTLVFALINHPNSANLLMASVIATIFIPCLIYGMQMLAKGLSPKKNDALKDEAGSK